MFDLSGHCPQMTNECSYAGKGSSLVLSLKINLVSLEKTAAFRRIFGNGAFSLH